MSIKNDIIDTTINLIREKRLDVEWRTQSIKNIRTLLEAETDTPNGFKSSLSDEVYSSLWEELGRLEAEIEVLKHEANGMEEVLQVIKKPKNVEKDEQRKLEDRILGIILPEISNRQG